MYPGTGPESVRIRAGKGGAAEPHATVPTERAAARSRRTRVSGAGWMITSGYDGELPRESAWEGASAAESGRVGTGGAGIGRGGAEGVSCSGR